MDLSIKLSPLEWALAGLVILVGLNLRSDPWAVVAVVVAGGVVVLGLSALRRGRSLKIDSEKAGAKASLELGVPSQSALGGRPARAIDEDDGADGGSARAPQLTDHHQVDDRPDHAADPGPF